MYGGRLLKSLPYYRRFGRPKATTPRRGRWSAAGILEPMIDSAFAAQVRARFPSLHPPAGPAPIFFDNPGGTQVPQGVPDAIVHYYSTSNANVGGAFATSHRTDAVIAEARQAMADLLHAPSPDCIVFGPSMTTLTFHLARSLADIWTPGDEVVVTTLDHDANITPWTDLEAAGAVVKCADIHPETCALDMESFARALSPRTRLVAVTHASNAVGVVPPVAQIVQMAHAVGALVCVDAVQYAPHGPIDVQALDCDFLACSAYKFFGPHLGILYGKREHLERLTPHKVRPAKNTVPQRWETGTLNHECLAGLSAAVEHLAWIGETFSGPTAEHSPADGCAGRALTLKHAMRTLHSYEQGLMTQLLTGLGALGDATLYGPSGGEEHVPRVPTVAWTWPRLAPRATCELLARHDICAWSGNYYALRLMERLGLEGTGGAVRLGLAHYNTPEEITTLLDILHRVSSQTR